MKRDSSVQQLGKGDSMTQPVNLGPQDIAARQRKSVLWVTNLAAPYRLPVWNHLAREYRLEVALLESNKSLGSDSSANRGRDWLHRQSGEVAFKELPTWKFHRGESRYYALKSLRSLWIVRKSDVVLFGGWESPAHWSLLLAAVVFGVGRVGFYESPSNTMTYKSGFFAWMRSFFFRSMDFTIVPGKAAASAVLSMKVRPDKIIQGFNAVNVAEFHSAASPMADEANVGPLAGHRYLYVGQLIERKRVDAIIDAYFQIAMPDDELTIVGEGPLRQELVRLAATRGPRVKLAEHIDNREMPLVMARNHTLVLASRREVWGLVVNEALASGMHVVVSDNCGVVPSVEGMRGVHVVKENLVNLAEQMKVSRDTWAGRIPIPEILNHTPEAFARVFDSAFEASANLHKSA